MITRPQVVIIDDDPWIQGLLQMVVEDWHATARVERADDSLVGRLGDMRPALVLMDIHPRLTPARWRLLERLRADPQVATVRMVVLSTDRRWLVDQEAPLAAMGIRILCKPFEVDVLVTMLTDLQPH